MTQDKTPTYIAYTVRDGAEKAHWDRIGAAWEHKSGRGLSIQLTALPVGGRFELLPNEPRSEHEG